MGKKLKIGVIALAAAMMFTACSSHRYYRANDPYYHDTHRWDDREAGYYAQWERDTHRDHREYRDRKEDEQKEYWTWRHQHNNDHDQDHHH